MKKWLWILVGGVCALGLILAVFLRGRTPAGSNWVQPKKGELIEAIYGISTVTARNKFSFKVGQTNNLKKLLVREGQDVKKGDELLELADGLKVRAPFDGTITSLPYNTGENIFPDTPVITMEDMKNRYLLTTLEQQAAIRVKKGFPVSLNFESFREKNFEGRVESVYSQKGQFLVHIEVNNLPTEILPGMTADASIEIARKQDALMVPLLAISNGKINILRNGKQQKIEVKIGSMDNEWAEVLESDLQLSDKVLVKK